VLLRFDDLDTPRNRAACEAIEADRGWLGPDWDGRPLFQSERRSLYDAALARLRSSGQALSLPLQPAMLADLFSPPRRMVALPGLCRAVPADWGTRMARQPAGRLRLAAGAAALA